MTPTTKISDYKTSHFSYDPTTGLITNNNIGKTFTEGTRSDGYVQISVQHKITNKKNKIMGHRLAWFLHYGTEPDVVIDHVDHDKTNNRINNLVSTSYNGNNQNRARLPKYIYMAGVRIDIRKKTPTYSARATSIRTGVTAYFGSYASELDAHYVATFYKQTNYINYYGFDLTDINGNPHPYFTGQLASIVANIVDKKGKSALLYMSK